MDNYPIGADTSDAPWNQIDNPEREIEVTVSVTLSKTCKIKVTDYELLEAGKDENGEYYEDIDYSQCQLECDVKNQIVLPQDAWKYVSDSKIVSDLKDWNVDDYEVML